MAGKYQGIESEGLRKPPYFSRTLKLNILRGGPVLLERDNVLQNPAICFRRGIIRYPKKDADGPQPERSGDSRRQMARIGLIFTDL